LDNFYILEFKSHLIDLLFKVVDGSDNILVRKGCSGLLAFMGGMERRKHPCLLTELTSEHLIMAKRFANKILEPIKEFADKYYD
jgi:hypothetical protein